MVGLAVVALGVVGLGLGLVAVGLGAVGLGVVGIGVALVTVGLGVALGLEVVGGGVGDGDGPSSVVPPHATARARTAADAHTRATVRVDRGRAAAGTVHLLTRPR